MAAPNLISATSIIGKTQAEWVTNTPTVVIANATNSSEIHRLNVLYVTNMGIADGAVTIDLFRGGNSYKLVYNLPVPVSNSVVAIAKDSSIYIEEGDSLRISASQAGILQYVVSYEVMS
jgi:hypothetical protein